MGKGGLKCNAQKPLVPTESYQKRPISDLNPNAPSWNQSVEMQNIRADVSSAANHGHDKSFEKLAATLRQGFTLPRPEIQRFDENPLNYWSFIRSFENNIDRNTSDESEKLTYLLQYFSGDAKRVISSCVTMDPTVGYRTARNLLRQRFGHPYTIASAHVKEITDGPPIKASDVQSLMGFADRLKNCENVLLHC
ncbi:uncharacterized protein LOC116604591 [Nematostella vectensis]|uniref:uncharacterized protein LOC116604591 n=1 Tax=Nematostella vectensis TaxID=45351 RepID=UPI0020774B70|nr:uncharacterized protein LOC116604591 [Nematostella vectensis]